MLDAGSARKALTAALAAVFLVAATGAVGARVPRYSGTITISAHASNPGGTMYSAYAYDGTATLRFAFSGSGHLRNTGRFTAALRGSYQTAHPKSDYRLCKGPDESGALSGTIDYYLSPIVLSRSVSFSFATLGETMTPNWHTVCGLPQAQAGGAHTLGLLGESIQAAEGKTLKFAFPLRGGTLKRSGTLRNLAPGDETVRTYTIAVTLKKTG